MNRQRGTVGLKLLLTMAVSVALFAGSVFAADIMTNGTFDSNISGWTAAIVGNEGTRGWDNSIFGNAQGSLRYRTDSGSRMELRLTDRGTTTATINSTDQVLLSFYWYKTATGLGTDRHQLSVSIVLPSGTVVEVWSDDQEPNASQVIDGNVVDLDISNDCSENGTYQIEIGIRIATPRNSTGYVQANFDDIVLDVPAGNAPPVVSNITDQSISEGSSFTTITLDNFVADPDNTDAEMTWSYSGNTELIVDITSRVATITTPNADWNGNETITFRATDPGSLWDEDPATFTVSAQNDPPVVTNIPPQSIAEGASFATITLDDYVSDVDNTDAQMTWTYSGNTELIVDITSRVATITAPDSEWSGAETITFRATDPGSLWDEDAALFTVTAQNDPPIVTNIPPQTVAEGSTFTTITLDDYVSDVDNTDAQMTWTYSGNTELTVDITSRIATITIPSTEWSGAETITFRATDPGLLWDEDTALFTVTAQNDPPVVTNIPPQTIAEGASFTTITLDDYVSDIDNTDAQMTWTYSGNTELLVDITSRVATITAPNADWNGAETITFRATDPGLDWDEDAALFTITAQNDPPVVTNIPNQTIAEGNSFTTITLDDYVSDIDNTDAQMTWTYSGNTELTVDITNRIATITTPGPTWQGDETITFRATDPGLDWDDDPATFTVTPQNDPPVVTNIPNQTIDEGSTFTTITLDDYVSDPDNTDAEMTWTYSGNSALIVDITSRIATITIPDIDWNGAEVITFRATDPGTLWDEDPATFTVTAQNDPPVVAVSATSVSSGTVNRYGTNTTVISAVFTDVDQPNVSVFNCTFRIRDGLSAELTLVNNQPNGGGGLTVTGGGGSYTASFTYNPDDAQTVDDYDLYFEVSDGTDNAIDGYGNNDNELQIYDAPPNSAPTIVAGAPQASVSPVNRYGANTTVLSAVFSDIDQPGIAAFNATLRIRDTAGTVYSLVNNQPNGGGDLSISDGGGGNYTASYTYNPGDAQILGLYDLYFEVTDGSDNAIDGYASNTDEMEIEEILPPTPPTVATGATAVSVTPVDRLGANTTVISANFADVNEHLVSTFNCTFRIREPNNSTELTLVNNQTDGGGGLTIVDNGSGTYTASYSYNPDDAQTQGYYDLYFEVTDGSTPAIDGYGNNDNELQISEVIVNESPVIATGATQVSPGSLDRVGAGTTTISATFNDADDPGVGAFSVTFKLQRPYGQGILTIADNLQNGQSGMSISVGSGTSYTASMDWDPPDNAAAGYYDLYCEVSDGIAVEVDAYADNADELLITSGGENVPPIVSSDAVFASPAGVERIGTNPTTLSATFTDGDAPAISVFRVSFKLRKPDNSTEVILATNAADGQSNVSISDLGGGVYTAAVDWDPADAETLGYWDLYFHVTDGTTDTTYDGYQNNLDEMELYDAVSNNAPTFVSDNTFALPVSINRIGSEFTMLKSTFTDVDIPGKGVFTISFKVRDPGSGETIVVDAAKHGEQGLRVVHMGGGTYEASVLWDPDVADATGQYDLQFEVTDDRAGSITDTYGTNGNELTVTSSAVLGDGNLLHRDNDADGCGGVSSACHNIADHQSQDCRVCHTPHSTSNIYLVRETIQTPNSGPRAVDFRTLGIGDPDNDPDPTAGTFAGVMADSTDGVFTGVCEVCHTDPTGHHRNDGSQPGPNHHDAENCTGCHPHSEGFAVSGGGESSGGAACSCHGSIYNPMNTSTTSYHHQMNSDGADYTISARTCLTCHVDHDIFRTDLNPGFGTRAANLRRDITTTVTTGTSAVLLNSDYESSGSGGICLSCHVSTQGKGYTQPDGTTQTPAISKTDYDAATSAHNYNVTSGYSDGSTFNGNCVKCHNDDMSKSYQNSATKFGVHDGSYRRILSALGLASPSDPLEETMCFECHSAGGDFYSVQSMSSSATGIQTAFTRTYTHPTTSYSGRHKPGETGSDLGDGNRHAECGDCHDPHAAQQGTHDGSSSLASNALKGTWGVEPTSWPTPTVPSNNANVFTAPTGYTRVEGAALEEWMICLKCHSNYTTLPSGSRNIAAEINPNYPSTHGITIANQNSYCNTTTMFEPWGSSGMTYCSDCHRSDNSGDPEGPHGSNVEHLLVATMVSDDNIGTPLCYACHRETVYWSDNSNGSRYGQHPSNRGGHKVPQGCFGCHMWDYADQSGLGVQTSEVLTDGEIFVHGQNKYWNFKDDDGSTGTGNPSDAFCNGYLADMDYAGTSCWSDEDNNGCSRSHNATSY